MNEVPALKLSERDDQPARESRGPKMRGFPPEISLPSLVLISCCKHPNWVLAGRLSFVPVLPE